MGRQCTARHGNQLLRSKAARDSESRNNEKEPRNQHVDSQGQVVLRSVRVDTGKSATVVAGSARVGIHDFGEAVGPVVADVGRGGSRRISIAAFSEGNDGTD